MSSKKVNLKVAAAAAGLDSSKSEAAVKHFSGSYVDLLGYLPPRIESRLTFTGSMDPTMVELQETMRSHAMNTPHLEPKVVQLMLFGMLLMDGNDAAETHAIASRREGASWDELQSVISLCFLFRGLPAANRGADMLASVAEREANAASTSKA
jgi:4-carboxymuconolactone decarboxylase